MMETTKGMWDKNVNELIKVAIRARPVCDKDGPALWKIHDNLIESISDRKQSIHQFDNVYDEKTTNEDLYNNIAAPIVNGVLEGFHGTIFAYGQTGSGKTHTMTGSPSDPGLIRMALREIFYKINNSTDRNYLVRTSYLEIYNEELHDLLNKDAKCLRIREENGFVRVQNLSQELPQTMEDVLESLSKAEEIRRFAETNMNARSSRSHTIFQILVDSHPIEGEGNESQAALVTSELNLVDLAGSERVGQTGATGDLLREGCFINRSLSSLCLVISKLSAGKQGLHIPYRDSKLTRILQNALGGNSRTVIVCTINMTACDQTDGTLNFARQAMRISTKPVKNELISKEAYISRLLKEMEELKKEMEKYKTADQSKMTRQAGMLRKWIESSNELMLTKSDNKNDIAQRRYSWAPGSSQRSFGSSLRFLHDRRMSPLMELTNLEDPNLQQKSFTPVKENDPQSIFPATANDSILNFEVDDEEFRCVTERNNELFSENTSLKVRLSCQAKDLKMLMEQIDSLRTKVLDLERFKEQAIDDDFNRQGALCDQEELKLENEKLRQDLDARAAEVEMFEERYLSMQARLKEQSRMAEAQRPPPVPATRTADAASEASTELRHAATNTEAAEVVRLEIVSQMEELQTENRELIEELQGLREVKKALDDTETLTRKNEASAIEKVNDFSRLIDHLELEIKEERRRKEEVEEEVEEERRERRMMEVTLERLQMAEEERRRQEMLAESERSFLEAQVKIDELRKETSFMDLTQQNEQLKEQVASLVTEVEKMKSEQEMDVLKMTLQERIKEVESQDEEEVEAKDCQDIRILRSQLEEERWKIKDLKKTIKMAGAMIHGQVNEEQQERHWREELWAKDEELEEMSKTMERLRWQLDEKKVVETNSLRETVEVIEKQLANEQRLDDSMAIDDTPESLEVKRTQEDRDEEMEDLRRKIAEEIHERISIENTKNDEVREVKRRLEEAEFELEVERRRILDLETEIRGFGEVVCDLDEAQRRIRELETETRGFGDVVRDRDEAQRRIRELETEIRDSGDVVRDLGEARRRIRELETEIRDFGDVVRDREEARRRIRELETETRGFGEVVRDLDEARRRIRELETETRGFSEVVRDLEEAQRRIRELETEIRDFGDVVRDLEEAQRRIRELETEIRDFGDVVRDLEEARRRIRELEEIHKRISIENTENDEVREVTRRLEEAEFELEVERRKILDLETKIRGFGEVVRDRDEARRRIRELETETRGLGEVVRDLEEARRRIRELEDENRLLGDSADQLDAARARVQEMQEERLTLGDAIRRLEGEKDKLRLTTDEELEKANENIQEMEQANSHSREAVAELTEWHSAVDRLLHLLSDLPYGLPSNGKKYEVVEALGKHVGHLRQKVKEQEIEMEELVDELRRFLLQVDIKLGDFPTRERLNHCKRALGCALEKIKIQQKHGAVNNDRELKKQLDESTNELSKKATEISRLSAQIEFMEEDKKEIHEDLMEIQSAHRLCVMRWDNIRSLVSLDSSIVEEDDVDRALEAMVQERNLCLPLYSFIVDCVETENPSGALHGLDHLIDDYLSGDEEFMGDRRKDFLKISYRLRSAYARKLERYKAAQAAPTTQPRSTSSLGVQTGPDERLAVLQRNLGRLQLEEGLLRKELQRKEEGAKSKIEEQQKELTDLHSQLRRLINAGSRVRENVQEQSFVVPPETHGSRWRLDPRVPSQTASNLFRRSSTSSIVSQATPPPPVFTTSHAATPPNGSLHSVTQSMTKTKEEEEIDDAIDEAEQQCRQQ